MTHKEQMQRGIEAALDAMPKRMRGCDMAHLFAQFIITYDMEPDTADIAVQTGKLIRMYIDDLSLIPTCRRRRSNPFKFRWY